MLVRCDFLEVGGGLYIRKVLYLRSKQVRKQVRNKMQGQVTKFALYWYNLSKIATGKFFQSLRGRAEPQGSRRPRVLGRFLGPGAVKMVGKNMKEMGKAGEM